jgi:hypothetical protein
MILLTSKMDSARRFIRIRVKVLREVNKFVGFQDSTAPFSTPYELVHDHKGPRLRCSHREMDDEIRTGESR